MITVEEAKALLKRTEETEIDYYLRDIEQLIRGCAEEHGINHTVYYLLARDNRVNYNVVLENIMNILNNNGFDVKLYDPSTKFGDEMCGGEIAIKMIDIGWCEGRLI